MTISDVTAVVVVIPVHNEAELLDRCLAALGDAVAAAAGRGIRSVVRIVLDDCTDDSGLIAEAHPFPTMVVSAARVGDARGQGVEAAMRGLRGVPTERIWIANSDADSAVPSNWIIAQCDLAAGGADVFIGTVRPDFADLSRRHQRHWLRTHSSDAPNGHVHGASLGIRANVYAAAGGFDPIEEHEDVELVKRCRLLGANLRPSGSAEVLTSGRFIGRTPGGYADYLRVQAELLGARS